jgi:import inner membrane translocase subunit TIM44
VRGVSWSAATSTAAEPKSSSSEEQRQQQQGAAAAGGEEQQQQQQDNSSSQQQEGEPQHLFSRLREKVFGGGENASSDTTTTAESAADRARRLLRAAAREVADAVLPREERVSLTRAYDGPVWQPGAESSSSTTTPSSTALAVAPAPPPSAAKKLLDDLRARFGSHPLFARLTAAASQAPGSAAAAGAAASASAAAQAAARKAQDAVDALREKYETSDHPAVHRAEEVKERLFGATEAAEALAEALRRDPTFDVAKLLASVKHDARTVVGAFLAHDLATLKQYAGSELLERLGGVFAHFDAQGGLREDPTILFVGDPELVEVRNVEGDPMVVVQFACQQIKATRDKFGNVVDGSPNSIQRVFYFWGLVQEKQGVVLPDGRPLPPRWALRDMMWQSVLALV